ncbi:MAG: GNAT family N-acetyltransferase [Prochlorotrichaceae cyanobacterium]
MFEVGRCEIQAIEISAVVIGLKTSTITNKMKFQIHSFDRKYDRSKFSCGKEPLDKYLKEQASQDINRNVASVFVLIEENKTQILAYYTLSSYIILIEELQDDFARRLPRYPQLPATLLGRLAVDQKIQRTGLGEFMLLDALDKALTCSNDIGSLAVVVQPLDDDAFSFYKKYGFQNLKQDPTTLYLPMKTVADLLKPSHS